MNPKILKYDYIIAGAGCSGLMMAFYLSQSGLKDKKVLIVDRCIDKVNDRTFAFWEDNINDFEELVVRKWKKIGLGYQDFFQVLDTGKYDYKMIRASDFYSHIQKKLNSKETFSLQCGDITEIDENIYGPYVVVQGEKIYADLVFDSTRCRRKFVPKPNISLKQHFKGWFVYFDSDVFNADVATFMDFRLPQSGVAKFIYVLPFDERRALVECAVIGPKGGRGVNYESELKDYISRFISYREYAIEECEIGLIEMCDAHFKTFSSPHIINIGINAGGVKGSSGYAFTRIQKQIKSIVECLEKTGIIKLRQSFFKQRFKIYDSTFLGVLGEMKLSGASVFANLMIRNGVARMFKFLDERSNLLEESLLFLTVKIDVFVSALFKALFRGEKKERFTDAL